MSYDTLMIDLYQLATLFAHNNCDKDRLEQRVQMSFFSRKMPTNRNYIVFAGLRHCLEYINNLKLDADFFKIIESHPMLGPALKRTPMLLNNHLVQQPHKIMAMKEGTLVFAAPAYLLDDKPFLINNKHVNVYEPYIQANVNFVVSKLIETPFLSYINYMSMVASKAARVVSAAQGKPVLEFGQRRAHPYAALDAAYAAYIAGCSGTSNVAAFAKYGIPALGTMDHFAVMGSERKNISKLTGEAEFFHSFTEIFPEQATLLVDTYDTENGIINAIAATAGKLKAIRIDSNVSVSTVKLARNLLERYGAAHAKIIVSDGLNEQKVQELAPYVDGFGVGENITCSPDSATGVGAVGKLIVNGYGKQTIKVSKGSGKLTLPGPVQVYRTNEYDLVTLLSESVPDKGEPLLNNVDDKLPTIEETRKFVSDQMGWLPDEFKNINGNQYARRIYVSNAFAELTSKLASEN